MNEFIYQRKEELFIAQILPVFFLIFLLFHSFGLHAEMFQTGAFETQQGIPQIPYYQPCCPRPQYPSALLDTSNAFSHKIIWLTQDANGAPIICSQEIDEVAYQGQPDEYCSPATLAPQAELLPDMPKETMCWESSDYRLFIQPDGVTRAMKK